MNEVLNCLETRRSCRAYRPEQVPEEALQEILRTPTSGLSSTK